MIYSHKSPALLIIGILMLLWGWMNNAGTLDGMQGWLHPGPYKEHAQAAEKHAADTKAAAEKAAAEGQPAPEAKPMKPSKFDGTKAGQAQLAYILGGLFTAVGVLVLVLPKKEGHLDYYAGVVPGMAFIVGIACAVRWILDPMFANWGKAAQPTLGWDFAKIMNLNYVVLGIVLGMIIVNLLRIPAFGLSIAGSVAAFTSQTMAYIALPFYFHDVMAKTPGETGLLMTPWALVIVVVAPYAGRLSDRYHAGMLGGLGMAMLAVGLALLASLPHHAGTADIVWRIVLCGVGFGLFQTPNNRTMIGSAPIHRRGGASGMQAMARLSGQTLGAAFMAFVFHVTAGRGAASALWVAAGFALLAGSASLMRLGKRAVT